MAKRGQNKSSEKVSQKEAEKLVQSGEAEIPADAIVQESSNEKSDYASHPKFAKFSKKAGK